MVVWPRALVCALGIGAVSCSLANAQIMLSYLGRTSQLPPAAGSSGSLATGDVNGDGFPDVVVGVWATRGAKNSVFLADRLGQFREADDSDRRPLFDPDRRKFTTAVALGDADGDGDLDVVFGNTEPDELYINDGTGHFVLASAAQFPAPKGATISLVFVDVDNDGDLDIVGGKLGQDVLYENDGRGWFTDATARKMPVVTEIARVIRPCDVDNDGDLDLVVGNNKFGPNGQNPASIHRLYINDGSGTYSLGAAGRLSGGQEFVTDIEVADLDLDGDLDIVVAHMPANFQGTGLDTVYINDGRGWYSDETSTRFPGGGSESLGVEIADFDLDGDPDLYFGNGNPSRDVLLLNDSRGFFRDASSLTGGNQRTLSLGSADFDLDGDTDLVEAYVNMPGNVIWNLHRHVHMEAPPRIGKITSIDAYVTPGLGQMVQPVATWFSSRVTPRPVKVPVLGLFHLDPATMVEGPILLVSPQQGRQRLSFSLPNVPSLVGRQLFVQGGVLHSAAMADWRFTNVDGEVISR